MWLSSLYEVVQEGLMTEHQQDREPVEAISDERIATRLHSWLLMMCLGYPVALLLMFLFGPWLAVEYVFSGLCLFVGTVYPIAMILILAYFRQQGKVPILWILVIGPAVWIAGLSWLYLWLVAEMVASC
jgi:hypothetical protein